MHFWKPFGHQTTDVLNFFFICLKMKVLGIFVLFWPSLLFLPFFSCNYEKRVPPSPKEEEEDCIYLPWSYDICSERTFFCLSHCKTRWIIIVENVKVPPPQQTFWGRNIRARPVALPENQDFVDPTKNYYPPAQLRKNHCPCILEGHLSTNPILSALHLQGPKSNICSNIYIIYVHFHWVNKQVVGISFSKWNRQILINLEVTHIITKSSLASRL